MAAGLVPVPNTDTVVTGTHALVVPYLEQQVVVLMLWLCHTMNNRWRGNAS